MKDRVVNPYLPSYEYMPDGEPHLFEGRLYVFGSHDKFGGKVYCENDYTCWSAPADDLSDWRCEGIIYKRTQDPTPTGLLHTHLWAPDVCRGADGRYYLYYAMEWYNRVGVAVAQTPAGPYEYYGEVRYADGTRYGGKPDERIRFDPAVLHENGVTYLYTGFSSDRMGFLCKIAHINITGEGSTVVRLGKDMLTIEGEPKMLLPGTRNSAGTGFEGHEFYEAMSMRKFGEKYYAVYSSVLSHELCYAVSDRPDGGFRFGGLRGGGFSRLPGLALHLYLIGVFLLGLQEQSLQNVLDAAERQPCRRGRRNGRRVHADFTGLYLWRCLLYRQPG